MTGWIVAALLLVLMIGLGFGGWLAFRIAPKLQPPPAPPAPAPEPAKVFLPPEPEETAHQLINQELREKMIEDFQERYNVSRDDAIAAVEEIMDKTNRLGADQY